VSSALHIRQLGVREYESVYLAMQQFTDRRCADTPDEFWCLQHLPVYTLGMAGKREHILKQGSAPLYRTDRGGQVTYHGPGQLIVYLIIDLRRKGIPVKRYVHLIEQAVIDFCEQCDVPAKRIAGAPGVYVNEKKIAALGIRVRHGRAYHGLALNVDMDLDPFLNINPCGYYGLGVTQLTSEGCRLDVQQACEGLLPCLINCLEYGDCRVFMESSLASVAVGNNAA